MHPFEANLSVSAEEIEFALRGCPWDVWANFILNPRRLRGSDFLMRWSQGVWSEERLVQAVNETGKFYALPYGPSGTAPDDDVRAFELYFERLEKAGLGKIKRPDLLIFQAADKASVDSIVAQLNGLGELPFTLENHPLMQNLLAKAIIAVECENSLWRARQMPDFQSVMKPQKRLGGQLGFKKSAVLPTVIIKEEDRVPLRTWQEEHHLPIHIWHVFYDLAFGLAFDDFEALIRSGKIEATRQVFQAPGGATTEKAIYKVYHHYAYELGTADEEPKLVADCIADKNGHILPYVKFSGGKLRLSNTALGILFAART
ncbi:MAG: AccI family restriction endonuclease [Candidatus Sumerlaeota bacterium]|nr:AccI family restriction endonuclease [Candidatus Sumerlaeota bacterium]